MSDRGRVQIFVFGRVQGVFFRDSTRHKALEVGVAGYVCNLRDGRVEVVAEGRAEDLGALIGWCGSGPPTARVEKVDLVEQQFIGDLEGFEIR